MRPGRTRHLPARALQPVVQDPLMKPQVMKPQDWLLQNKSSRTVRPLSSYQSISGLPRSRRAPPLGSLNGRQESRSWKQRYPSPATQPHFREPLLTSEGKPTTVQVAPHCKEPGWKRGEGSGRRGEGGSCEQSHVGISQSAAAAYKTKIEHGVESHPKPNLQPLFSPFEPVLLD